MSSHDVSLLHPECAALDGSGVSCSCIALWGFNPDEQGALDRAIALAIQEDSRAAPSRRGHGSDADEPLDLDTTENPDSAADTLPDGQFWKRSEYLKCRRGEPMSSDYRGLPHGYGQGPTWIRARERG